MPDKNLSKSKIKKTKPLKKFKGDGGESDTKLEPYKREKVDLRDVDDLMEDDDVSVSMWEKENEDSD